MVWKRQLNSFLSWMLDRGEWSVLHPDLFTPKQCLHYALHRRKSGANNQSVWQFRMGFKVYIDFPELKANEVIRTPLIWIQTELNLKECVLWIIWNCGWSACSCNIVADPVVWCFIFCTQFWCKEENKMMTSLWFPYAKMMLMGTDNHLLLCIKSSQTSRFLNSLRYLTI